MTDQPSYRLIAAGIITLIYLIIAGILLYMIVGTGVAPEKWDQVVFIFNAIGALATVAAGVLLGAEVQQANVNNARNEAQEHAADAARTRQVVADALTALDPAAADATDTAALRTGGPGAGRARQILLNALVKTPREA